MSKRKIAPTKNVNDTKKKTPKTKTKATQETKDHWLVVYYPCDEGSESDCVYHYLVPVNEETLPRLQEYQQIQRHRENGTTPFTGYRLAYREGEEPNVEEGIIEFKDYKMEFPCKLDNVSITTSINVIY